MAEGISGSASVFNTTLAGSHNRTRTARGRLNSTAMEFAAHRATSAIPNTGRAISRHTRSCFYFRKLVHRIRENRRESCLTTSIAKAIIPSFAWRGIKKGVQRERGGREREWERATSTQRTQEEGKCKNKIQNSKREDSDNEGKKQK